LPPTPFGFFVVKEAPLEFLAFLAAEPAVDSATLAIVISVFAGLALIGLFLLRPLLFLRPFLWVLTHTLYRLSIYGPENVPAQGPVLLVCNHVSYIDWLLLLAAQKRFIRFVIWAPYTRMWGIRRVLRWAGVIPIDSSSGPKAIVKSLHDAADALKAGELVCIFAEGNLTKTGFMLPFHRGFEQILKRTPAPVVPVCLDHVWGSIFSYHGGKMLWKWPQELPYPVSVAFGLPLPATSSAAEVRLAIQKLSADCAVARSERRVPVHRQFVRVASRRPFLSCVGDSTRPRMLRYFEALSGAILLSRKLRPLLGEERMVGVWLPPSVGGALTNVAIAFLGKISVNLNYTLTPENVQAAARQCALRHVITSRRFTEKVSLDAGPGVELIYLEDFVKVVSRLDRLRAALAALLLPSFVLDRWLLKLHNTRLDDTATIIFSSGSTGEPKGVVLTHRNIAANVESMIQAIDLSTADRVLGVLPFFHSFGYTVTLWAPLQLGASASYHPDPRQAKEIGEIGRNHRCTIFLTTPTFLRYCLRRCEPDDFQTLRILMCGAEKLPQSLAKEFHEKFGVQPLEGYGCTELSPAAAANVPDRVIGGDRQVGNKPGTIGQPLPGIAAKVVHPETMEPLPPGQEGLLLIYGANVMQGYLNRPELTEKAIRNGWYVTGDIACIDEDGFLTITGRLSRFAKVGGEMVPLERIEDELQTILGTNDRAVAVAAVPDEKRGERLVVLHLPLDGLKVKDLCDKLGERGLPNLWVPGERDFFQIAELPVLGSGKIDLKRLKDIALERASAAKAG
jgi:acyl-[acyl-carrier-protein]-phospholipid O-acyltransferase/long-chain-fatty-acid--[acyl-carrier-protein] ligase